MRAGPRLQVLPFYIGLILQEKVYPRLLCTRRTIFKTAADHRRKGTSKLLLLSGNGAMSVRSMAQKQASEDLAVEKMTQRCAEVAVVTRHAMI